MQAHERADGDHDKGAEGRNQNGPTTLLVGEVLCVMDEKRDDGQKGDEWFEVHGGMLAVCHAVGRCNEGYMEKVSLAHMR